MGGEEEGCGAQEEEGGGGGGGATAIGVKGEELGAKQAAKEALLQGRSPSQTPSRL